MISVKNIPALLQSPRFRLNVPYSDIDVEAWQWLLAIFVGLLCFVLPSSLALGLMIAVPVGLAVLNNPLYGLVLTMFLGPMGAWEKVEIGGPIAAVTSGQLILLLTLASWLGRGLKRGRIHFPSTPFNLPLLAFIAMGAVSLWWAEDVIGGVKELLKWIEALLIIWMILDLTREYRPKQVVRGLIALLLGVALFQGIWGVWQFRLRGTGPSHFIIRNRFYRATGSFQQPNPFGGFMAMMSCLGIGVTVGLIVKHLDNKRPTVDNVIDIIRTQPLVRNLVFINAITVTALIGSWSRGAWFNFAFGIAIFVMFFTKDRLQGVLIVAGSGIGFFGLLKIGVFPASFSNRLIGFLDYFSFDTINSIDGAGINPDNFAVLERLAHWKAAIDMAADNLWTGVGLGNYEVAYLDYNVRFWNEPLGHAHNYYLNMLAEGGVWGLVVYIGMWLAIFYQTARAAQNPDWFERGAALGLLAAWAGMALHHLLDNLYVNNMYIQIGVMLTLVVMLQLSASETKRAKAMAETQEAYDIYHHSRK